MGRLGLITWTMNTIRMPSPFSKPLTPQAPLPGMAASTSEAGANRPQLRPPPRASAHTLRPSPRSECRGAVGMHPHTLLHLFLVHDVWANTLRFSEPQFPAL